MEISATEFARNFGHYREVVQREPVAVTSHNRITGYFVSAAEYEAYLKLKEKAELDALKEALAPGIRQAQNGEVAEYSLDDLLKE